jgi:hypothetical protein
MGAVRQGADGGIDRSQRGQPGENWEMSDRRLRLIIGP